MHASVSIVDSDTIGDADRFRSFADFGTDVEGTASRVWRLIFRLKGRPPPARRRSSASASSSSRSRSGSGGAAFPVVRIWEKYAPARTSKRSANCCSSVDTGLKAFRRRHDGLAVTPKCRPCSRINRKRPRRPGPCHSTGKDRSIGWRTMGVGLTMKGSAISDRLKDDGDQRRPIRSDFVCLGRSIH